MYLLSAFAFALVPLGLATPLVRRWDDHKVKHSWIEVPKGWEVHSDAPADHMLDMRIALKQRDMPGLEAALMAVSDPSSPTYGQHLSKEEVESLLADLTEGSR